MVEIPSLIGKAGVVPKQVYEGKRNVNSSLTRDLFFISNLY